MDCRPVLKANCNAAYLYYASFLSKDKQKSMINPCKPDFFLPSLANYDHNSKHYEQFSDKADTVIKTRNEAL